MNRIQTGLSATAYVAFFVSGSEGVEVPIGTKVSAHPTGERDGEIFETSESLTAYPNLNQMSPVGSGSDLFVGNQVDLEGNRKGLDEGRVLVITGQVAPSSPRSFDGGEVVTVADATAAKAATRATIPPGTFLLLTKPMISAYRRETVKVYGNVVKATHGETVNEVLGSGAETSPTQTFVLSRRPVIYLPSPNGSGVRTSLYVYVDGLLWDDADHVPPVASKGKVYKFGTDKEGNGILTFGDGVPGKRLPTGADNVVARYRVGVGIAGNVDAGKLQTLLDRPRGVESVTNPLPASGGADIERIDEARSSAPAAMRTLGRLVSLRDYEEFARAFPGIREARARRIWDGQKLIVVLTVRGKKGMRLRPWCDLCDFWP